MQRVETVLIGYCQGCNIAHIREHTYTEKHRRYCKRTNALITDLFRPFIPLVVGEDVANDPAFSLRDDPKTEEYPDTPPLSMKDWVDPMLEELLFACGVNRQNHETQIGQMVCLIDPFPDQAKKPVQVPLPLHSGKDKRS